MLYIIATPIGNLEDITLRALRILKEVDYIFCEDTRVTRKLLDHYQIIGKKLISYHQHSDAKKVDELIKLVEKNKVALVTDAGTPGISDPGNKLIKALNHKNIKAIPVPGACALITALSVSGVPTDKFIFKGFIPHKKGREKFLDEVMASKITVVFYESPYRILKTLDSLKNTQLVVCRELTKKFETIYRGTAEEILAEIKKDFPNGSPKGEFVVINSS